MGKKRPDPYQVLGLSPEADLDCVRRAFRESAKIHHPDRPGGSAEAFRIISSAYDQILRRLGSGDEENFRPRTGPLRGEDILLDLFLDLEDVVRGMATVVRYARDEPCPECRVRLFSECPPCSACGGSTLVSNWVHVPVEAPAGLESNMLLRLPGQGHFPPLPAYLPGDLFLKALIRPHALFKPRGLDLHLRWDPSAWPSGRADLPPTLYGPVRLEKKPRVGQTVRLPGLGLPGFDFSGRGDLFVHY